MTTFVGTSGNDTFTGDNSNDLADGNGGGDALNGGGGNDDLAGNAGADVLDGGDGSDVLYSANRYPGFGYPYSIYYANNPTLDTGAEPDRLNGGAGDDYLFAGFNDTVDGGLGNDFVYLSLLGATAGVTMDFRQATIANGAGAITGIENVNWLQGSNFDDDLTLNSGSPFSSSVVYAMGGNDRVVAGYYTTAIFGGDGNDLLDGRASQYLARIEGGAGTDTIYTDSNTFAVADGGSGGDTIYSHGETYGGAGNDLIILQQTYYPGLVFGDDGDDEIRAAASGNRMIGGTGADLLVGANGGDTLISGDLGPNLSIDTAVDAGLEYDRLYGASGDDLLIAGYGDDVDGGSGNDTLRYSLRGLTAGVNFDTATFANAFASGQTISYGGGTIANVETFAGLAGTSYDDTINVSTQATRFTVDGGGGNDVVTSNGNSVTFNGGSGNDRLISGPASDTFDGGIGIDTIDYSGAASGVTVTLAVNAANGASTGTGAGGDQLISIEQVIGSGYSDVVSDSDVVTRLDLGGGDDTWRVGGSALRVLYGGGGDGFDTIEVANTHYNIAGNGLTGFERLVLQAGGNFQNFSGFQQITLAAPGTSNNGGPGGQYQPGTMYNFVNSLNPFADLVVASQSLRLHSSTVRSITGSAGGETVSLGNGAAVGQPIQLGAGDDRFTIDLLLGGMLPTFAYANGGEGKDVFEILTANGTATTVAAGATGGFETVLVNVGYIRAADVTLTGLLLNFGTLQVGQGTRLTLQPANLTESLIQGAFGGGITISAGSTVGRYGMPDEGPYDRSVDLTGRDATLSVQLVNNGAITNGVKFYIGDDVYDGRNGFLAGDVYGNGGNDTLLGGAENERLFGGYGDDLLAGGRGSNTLSGGAGNDTAGYADATAGVRVSLAVTAPQVTGGAGTDTLSGIENLLGSAFADVLTGDAGANRLTGGGGDDRLDGGAGNDRIDGGAGRDTAHFAGLFRGAALTTAGGTTTISGAEGVDTLTSVEVLQFTDGRYVLDADSDGAQLIRLYDAVLQRAPDDQGFDLWLDQMQARGMSLTQVASVFINSGEFQAATGALSTAQFVDYMYRNALGRDADADGRANWTSLLDTGASRADMVVLFSESGEHRNRTAAATGAGFFDVDTDFRTVALLYDAFNHRQPDLGGLLNWTNALKTGYLSLAGVAQGFVGSAEFQNATQGMDNGRLVDFMYQNTLLRAPDPTGRANWVGALDNGLSQADLLLGFAFSTEHIANDLSQFAHGVVIG